MQDPTTTTSNFELSSAILILKEATEIHGRGERKQGYYYISFIVHDETTAFQSADSLFVVARIALFLLGVADTVKVYFLLFRWNEWKIMPLFDVIGLGSEKLAVVIDIGAAYTK